MSLVGMYGGHKNDRDLLIRQGQELMNIASAPLIIYKIKDRNNQPTTDDLYGEITEKLFYKPLELKGFFENPTLIQELLKMGIDMPESITIFFDIIQMQETLGRELAIGDLIQPYHQRQQIYIVQDSFPNQASERLFKYTQWQVTAEKRELSGIKLPPYLTFEGLVSWVPFGEHWNTNLLQDRETHLQDRDYQIFGDKEYFWQHGSYYDNIEIGAFNGENNYLNFGNAYEFGSNSFTISSFYMPDDYGVEECLFKYGDKFYIKKLVDDRVEVYIDGQTFSTNDPFFTSGDGWVQLAVTAYPHATDSFFGIYKNGLPVDINQSTISSYDLSTDADFLMGANAIVDMSKVNCRFGESGYNEYDVVSGIDYCLYRGLQSNLRVYYSSLTNEEILNDYENLITRPFYQLP